MPLDDEAAFARSLEALLTDGERRATIGHANERHVRAHYPLEAMTARYDALFSASE